MGKAADSPVTGDLADLGIISIIGGLGILVGFAWEQSFDGGVEVIAELTPYPILAQLGMAILVALVVVTPWRRYILDTLIQLADHREGIEHSLGAGTLGLTPTLETEEHRLERLEAESSHLNSPGRDAPQSPAAFMQQLQVERTLEQCAKLKKENVELHRSIDELQERMKSWHSNAMPTDGNQQLAPPPSIRYLPPLPENLPSEVQQHIQKLTADVQSLELERARDAAKMTEMRELTYHSDIKCQMVQGEFDRLLHLYQQNVGTLAQLE